MGPLFCAALLSSQSQRRFALMMFADDAFETYPARKIVQDRKIFHTPPLAAELCTPIHN